MNRKNTYIAVALSLAVVVLFISLGFFNSNTHSMNTNVDTQLATPQSILNELQTTGTVSDLRVSEITPGTGTAVVLGDTITVHYVGVLPDGTVFDSSVARGEPATFVLGPGLIQGWQQGLVGMQEGGRRLLVIPPSLGYGAAGVGTIPPNATLIFDIELLQVQKPQ